MAGGLEEQKTQQGAIRKKAEFDTVVSTSCELVSSLVGWQET